jgi:hypothetical protein
MSFKRGNLGKFLTSATPSSLELDGMCQPLPQAFPEYCVVKRPNGVHEFRVEAQSYFKLRNASVPYHAGLFDWALVLIFPVLGTVVWRMVCTLLVYAHETPLKLPPGSSLDPYTRLSGIPSPVRILVGNTSTLG